MSDEYRKKIGIPDEHEFVQVDSSWKQKHGWDRDTYVYEERDKAGNVIAKYEVVDETHIYPPQERQIRHRKL